MSFQSRKKQSDIIQIPKKHNWSIYQKSIFREIAKGEGHLIIQAFAGSGKTATIIESFKYVPKGKKIIALAFNKIIQEELKARSPSYVEALTFHSLGRRAIISRFGNVELDENKVFDIVSSLLSPNQKDYDLIGSIADTVAFCKYGLLDTPEKIEWIIDNFNIDYSFLDKEEFIRLVVQTLRINKEQTSKIDYNDMCWFPFVYNLALPQADFVYVDEVYDLNKSQMIMAKKVCRPNNGRIVLAGDELQQLYSWRLADLSVIDAVKKEPATKTLTLPISYRCPTKIIELAKYWAPEIQATNDAKEGEIVEITLNQIYDIAKPGCFILSRINAPLIKICMNFIRLGIKANIRGRDVGKNLSFLIKRSKKKQIPAFLKWLETWKDDEVKKLQAKHINPENVLDKYECLANLCDEYKSLDEVNKKINELFDETDEKNIIVLSSCHKSKGLERDNVFILKWTFRLWLDEQTSSLSKPNEEMNIAYVAATRSKDKLYLVHK